MDSRDGVEMLRTPTGVLPNWIAGRLLLVLRFRLQYAHGWGQDLSGLLFTPRGGDSCTGLSTRGTGKEGSACTGEMIIHVGCALGAAGW